MTQATSNVTSSGKIRKNSLHNKLFRRQMGLSCQSFTSWQPYVMKKINKLEDIFGNFCVSLGELQPCMVSFYRKLDSSKSVHEGRGVKISGNQYMWFMDGPKFWVSQYHPLLLPHSLFPIGYLDLIQLTQSDATASKQGIRVSQTCFQFGSLCALKVLHSFILFPVLYWNGIFWQKVLLQV